MNTAEIVKQNLAQKISDGFGIELVEVEYAKKQNGMNLTLYIDKKDGITIDDCEAVHKFVDPLLDEINPTNDAPYTLNVSSLGLDWKLVSDNDFNRVLNEQIEVTLFAKLNGKKEYVGELKTFDAQNITIEEDGNSFILPRKQIAKAVKYLDF